MNTIKLYDKKYKNGYGIQFPEGHIVRIYQQILLYKLNTSPKTMLDFGCGNGTHVNFFHSLGINSQGVDNSSQAIDEAKKRYPHIEKKFILIKNIFDLEGKYDLILANQVLYYLNDSQLIECINKLKSLLNKGGILIITMMSKSNYYYDNSIHIGNGMRKVFLTGRIQEEKDINFKTCNEMKNLLVGGDIYIYRIL